MLEVLPGHTAIVPPSASGNYSGQPIPVHHPPEPRLCREVYEPEPGELNESQRAQEAAMVELIRERERRVAEWREQVPKVLSSIDDPTARLMAVIGNWGREGLVRSGLFPESTLHDLDRSPPWNHDAVQRWFLASVTTPPVELNAPGPRRGMLAGARPKPGRSLGWIFEQGSTHRDWIPDERDLGPGSPGREVVATLQVLRDGRLLSSGRPARPSEGFNFKALEQMAGMSRIERLPAAPPLTARQDAEDRHAGEQAPATYAALRDIMNSRGLRTQKF